MTKHNFSTDKDSKWVRPAVAAGIGIPAGYAAYQYGGNLGTYLGDRTNVEHTAKLLVPVQRSSLSLNPYQTMHRVSYQEFPAVSSTKPVIDFTKPLGGFQRLDNPMMGEDEITETKIGNIDPDTFRRMEHLAGNALGIDTDLSQANVPITDLPQQELIDKATRLLVQSPVKFIVNHSRRPSRFVALHTNFAKRKSDVANPDGVVINLPNGKKYTF